MPAEARRLPGRPRGSGLARQLGQLALSQSEWRVADAGLRAGRAQPGLVAGYEGNPLEIWPYLTAADQRALRALPERYLAKWLGIGLLVAGVEATIRIARGE